MFRTIVDLFSDDILDYLSGEDLSSLEKVAPGSVRMYKSSYLQNCLSFVDNMYVECSHCEQVMKGKYRKGVYICINCLTDIISISIV